MPHLEHIGIAVRDAPHVEALFQTLFGFSPYKSETVEPQEVRTIFVSAGTAKLELLEALSEESPISRFLDKRGEGIHHLAFEVDDLQAEMDRLRAAGFQPLSEQPITGADGKLIFFLHPRQTHGILVEFCQQIRTELNPVSIPYADGQLTAYSAGDPSALPVVLLHGGLGSTSMETAPFLHHLEKEAFVTALDFSGHGASDDFTPDGPLPPPDMGQVTALMDHFEIPKAVLFGFSMGGSIALHLAHTYPERVSHLILMGVNTIWDEAALRTAMRSIEPDWILKNAPAWAARLTKAHGSPRWETLARRLQHLIPYYAERALTDAEIASIKTPTLVCTGDRDRIYSLEHSLHLYRTLANGQLAVLPGIGHNLQQVNTAWLVDLILEFVRSS